jgi:hypothetical protein
MTSSIKKVENSTKRGRGRPPKEIDLSLVEKLAQIHCIDEEIAACCGVSYETFKRRKQEKDFAHMLEEARGRGKASLRRMQWQAAQSGSIPMMIFLGKNLLGQRDKFDDVPVDRDPLPWSD